MKRLRGEGFEKREKVEADVMARRLCGRSGGPGLGRAAARGGEKGGLWARTWMEPAGATQAA